MREEISRLHLNEETTNFSTDGKELNFNNIWSRKNYLHCNDTGYELNPSGSYPILNDRVNVNASLLEEERGNINERIHSAITAEGDFVAADVNSVEIPAAFDWSKHHTTITGSPIPQLLCHQKWNKDHFQCQNKFIFTKEGRFVVTAILLDPVATACDLRVSFIVKVNRKS